MTRYPLRRDHNAASSCIRAVIDTNDEKDILGGVVPTCVGPLEGGRICPRWRPNAGEHKVTEDGSAWYAGARGRVEAGTALVRRSEITWYQ